MDYLLKYAYESKTGMYSAASSVFIMSREMCMTYGELFHKNNRMLFLLLQVHCGCVLF